MKGRSKRLSGRRPPTLQMVQMVTVSSALLLDEWSLATVGVRSLKEFIQAYKPRLLRSDLG